MKYSFIIIFIIFFSNANGQVLNVLPIKDGLITYEEVVEFSESQNEVFSAVLKTIPEIYKDANDVLQLDDREAGSIIAKGFFIVTHEAKFLIGKGETVLSQKINHKLKIDFREGRYRITLTNFTMDNIYYPLLEDQLQMVEEYPSIENPKNTRRKTHESQIALLNAFDEYVRVFINEINVKIKANLKDDW